MTLCVLSAILVISQLVRLSDVLANFGLSLENILLPFLFIVLPFLSFTIPMAYMFAVLIGFSRLSSDGEYTALLAAGYSMKRAVQPVLMMGAILYIVGAFCASYLEPWGRRELIQFYHRKAQTELDNLVRYKLQPGVFVNDFLGFVLYAESISQDRSRMESVLLAPGKSHGDAGNFVLTAPSGSISGTVEDGDLKLAFDYGVIYSSQPQQDDSTVVKFRRAEVDLVRIFQDQIFGDDEAQDDYRSYPPGELYAYIDTVKDAEGDRERKNYLKSRFLFHQRIANPFGALVFALFAMVLGVQDQRRGKGAAWIGTIAYLMGGYVLIMGFKWLGEKGYMIAPLAAWTPNLLLLAFGGFLVYQKNRLPPSESALNPEHIPFLKHLLGR